MSQTLKAQSRALDPDRARKLLDRVGAPSGWKIHRVMAIVPVRLRPGRRMVIRYTVEGRAPGRGRGRYVLYGKLYRGHAGERAWAAHQLLAPRLPAQLRLPAVVGYEEPLRFLLLEELAGPLLSDELWSQEAHLHLGAFAAALADFHGCCARRQRGLITALKALRTHDARAEAKVLEDARLRIIESLLPTGLKQRFAACHLETLRALRQDLPALPIPLRTVVHRDLYPQQVVVMNDALGLLDLDEASVGEPELDIGNVCAHLYLSDLQDLGVVGAAMPLVGVFLQSYASRRSFADDRLRTYAAGSLLRLASLERVSSPAVSVLRWPQLAAALVREAQRVLDEGLPSAPEPARAQTQAQRPCTPKLAQ